MLKRLHKDGWYYVQTQGDHRQFKHPTKLGKVTVAGHPHDEIAPGTLKNIYEQAGWEKGT